MYIWRRKNRRDKRNLLDGGDLLWGSAESTAADERSDEMLRYENECAHVRYFTTRARDLILGYLDTEHGERETAMVVHELEKHNLKTYGVILPTELDAIQQTKLKKSVAEIFRRYMVDPRYVKRISVDGATPTAVGRGGGRGGGGVETRIGTADSTSAATGSGQGVCSPLSAQQQKGKKSVSFDIPASEKMKIESKIAKELGLPTPSAAAIAAVGKDYKPKPNEMLIGKQGLKELFAFLGVKMREKEFVTYCKKLGLIMENHAIPFEAFYANFLEELQERNKKARERREKRAKQSSSSKNGIVISLASMFGGDIFMSKKTINEEILDDDNVDVLKGTTSADREVGRLEAMGSADKSSRVSVLLQRKLLESEARVTITDHAVCRAQQIALTEYRVAHPPRHVCEECQASFPSHRAYLEHKRGTISSANNHKVKRRAPNMVDIEREKREKEKKMKNQELASRNFGLSSAEEENEDSDHQSVQIDNVEGGPEYHVALLKKRLADEEKFAFVDKIFASTEGRKIRANRMIYSLELGGTESRLASVVLDPFRPHLSDPTRRREKQLQRGMLVQGFDPTRGVRAGHIQLGMLHQHQAPSRNAPSNSSPFHTVLPQLQDVINDLLRCKDDFIDTITTCVENEVENEEENGGRARMGQVMPNLSILQSPGQSLGLHSSSSSPKASLLGYKGGERGAGGAAAVEGIAAGVYSLSDGTSTSIDASAISRQRAADREVQAVKQHHQLKFAKVCFEWNGFAEGKVFIKGEFTGWKPVPLSVSAKTGKFQLMTQLCVGTYKYRFIVDGRERVDEVASQITELSGYTEKGDPLYTTNNTLMVTNAPLKIKERPLFSVDQHVLDTSTFNKSTSKSRNSLGIAMNLGDSPGKEEDDDNSEAVQQRKKRIIQGGEVSAALFARGEGTKNSRKVLIKARNGQKTSINAVLPHISEGKAATTEAHAAATTTVLGIQTHKLSPKSKDSSKKSPNLALIGGSDASTAFESAGHTLNNHSNNNTNASPPLSPTSFGNSLLLGDNTKGKGRGNDGKIDKKEEIREKVGRITHISKVERDKLIHRLESINLRNMSLYDDGAWTLAFYIQRNSFIRSVDLSYNLISDDGIAALALSTERLIALRELKLNGNAFGYDGCLKLAHSLAKLTQLRTLELSNNKLGDDGMEAICAFLRHNEILCSLYLDSCLIGDDGMESLEHALTHNRRLQYLSLTGNRIGMLGMRSLSEGLACNAALKELNISGNALGPDAGRYIGDIIAKNDTIVRIDAANVLLIGANGVITTAIYSICYALQKNSSLTALDLRNNKLQKRDVMDFGNALMANHALLYLDLSANPKIPNEWFLPNMTIKTPKVSHMPSIRTSLDRNARRVHELQAEGKFLGEDYSLHGKGKALVLPDTTSMAAQTQVTLPHASIDERPIDIKKLKEAHKLTLQAAATGGGGKKPDVPKDNPKAREIDPSPDGKWNPHRKWKKIVISSEEKIQKRNKLAAEERRMKTEADFLHSEMHTYMTRMKHYLQEPPCVEYLTGVAKAITQYIFALANFDPEIQFARLHNPEHFPHHEFASLNSSQPQQQQLQELGKGGKNENAQLKTDVVDEQLLKLFANSGNVFRSRASRERSNSIEAKFLRPINHQQQRLRSKSANGSKNATQQQSGQRQQEQQRQQQSPTNKVEQKLREKLQRDLELAQKRRDEEAWSGERLELFLSTHYTILHAIFMNTNSGVYTKGSSAGGVSISRAGVSNRAQSASALSLSLSLMRGGTAGISPGASRGRSRLGSAIASAQAVSSSRHADWGTEGAPISESSFSANARQHLMIHPEKMGYALQALALFLPKDEVQRTVDATVLPIVHKIGLSKFAGFLLYNAKRLANSQKSGRLERMRVLADLLFVHPPIEEAQTIILDNLYHNALKELRTAYRNVPENRPLFCCNYCHKRFSTKVLLRKHLRKGYNSADHRRHRFREKIYRSQSDFLLQVKWSISGLYFPAYFEVVAAHKLPSLHYSPQIVDKIGYEGRPIGVVNENRTVRAVDIFGEYLMVTFNGGETGWVRYRTGKKPILQPACASVDGFDWGRLHIQEHVSYYRVSDNLPETVELKVRYQPLLSGEVCGYLRRGQVVECFAVIGDWLQVHYENEDSAWVLWRREGSGRLYKDHAKEQKIRERTQLRERQRKLRARAQVLQGGNGRGGGLLAKFVDIFGGGSDDYGKDEPGFQQDQDEASAAQWSDSMGATTHHVPASLYDKKNKDRNAQSETPAAAAAGERRITSVGKKTGKTLQKVGIGARKGLLSREAEAKRDAAAAEARDDASTVSDGTPEPEYFRKPGGSRPDGVEEELSEAELEKANVFLRRFRAKYKMYHLSKEAFFRLNDLTLAQYTKGGPIPAVSRRHDVFLVLLPPDIQQQMLLLDPCPVQVQRDNNAEAISYKNMGSSLNGAIGGTAAQRVKSPFPLTERQLLECVLNQEEKMRQENTFVGVGSAVSGVAVDGRVTDVGVMRDIKPTIEPGNNGRKKSKKTRSSGAVTKGGPRKGGESEDGREQGDEESDFDSLLQYEIDLHMQHKHHQKTTDTEHREHFSGHVRQSLQQQNKEDVWMLNNHNNADLKDPFRHHRHFYEYSDREQTPLDFTKYPKTGRKSGGFGFLPSIFGMKGSNLVGVSFDEYDVDEIERGHTGESWKGGVLSAGDAEKLGFVEAGYEFGDFDEGFADDADGAGGGRGRMDRKARGRQLEEDEGKEEDEDTLCLEEFN